MTTRPPSGPDSDQPHLKLGALVRDVLAGRNLSAPVPIIPAPLRLPFRGRRRAGRLLPAMAGAAAVAVAGLALVGTQRLRAVGYVVEKPRAGAGVTRLRFSDGSVALADSGTRLSVTSTGRTFAQLRLEEGRARLHVAGGARVRFAVAAGPYLALAAGAADLDLRWSAGALAASVTSGAATLKGPFAKDATVHLVAGQSALARGADRGFRIGATRAALEAARGHAPATAASRCQDREPGPPSGAPADEGSAPVWLDGSGCLGYSRDARGNRLPDFSWAGYRGGGVPIPFVPRAATVSPSGRGDDTPAIQAALDAAARLAPDASGLRGAVELGPGTFTLHGSVRINASGVVLRGQGASGPQATVLRGVGPARSLVVLGSEGRRTLATTFHRVLDGYVPIGERDLELDSAEDLQPGDDVVVRSSGLIFERRVTDVDGNRITVDVPLTDDLDRDYTDVTIIKYTFAERVSDVGVERLAGLADFDPGSDLGDGVLVDVAAAMNGWVRQLEAGRFEGGAVGLDAASKWVTVQEVVYDAPAPTAGNSWSRAFALGGQQNLIVQCRSVGARQAVHSWSRTAGPNVVLDFVGTGASTKVSVGRWTSGLLLDHVRMALEGSDGEGGEMATSQRGRGGRGWSPAGPVVWSGAASHGGPESLYRAQLAERLGPAALSAVGP